MLYCTVFVLAQPVINPFLVINKKSEILDIIAGLQELDLTKSI